MTNFNLSIIVFSGSVIELSREKDPSNMPWEANHIDIVLECTGVFATMEKASVIILLHFLFIIYL